MKKNQYFKKEIEWLLKEKYPCLAEPCSSPPPILLFELFGFSINHRTTSIPTSTFISIGGGSLRGKGKKLFPGLEKDIQRLKNGEPIDYVIGFSKFLGSKIDLSLKPLIPRPETEYWVEKAIGEIKALRKKEVVCLDIFAGSGCIGTAILKKVKNAKVDFAEKEKGFLGQIKINTRLNKIDKRRYRIIHSDIFSSLKRKYDYILANPPYLTQKRVSLVQKSVLKFEPRETVLAGEGGLFYIRKFLRQARNYLKKDGKIYLEFDSFQKKEITRLLKEFDYQKRQFFRDQYGKWRYLTGC